MSDLCDWRGSVKLMMNNITLRKLHTSHGGEKDNLFNITPAALEGF